MLGSALIPAARRALATSVVRLCAASRAASKRSAASAFQIGFMIFIPFLIIDMVVASVLMSMGMMMLSPLLISLPFKLIFFVLVDGWHLVAGSLVRSFTSG